MILERLVLENFRQFIGRQEIVFSDVRERNVTLVHAENGFGKTTLLKALLWALYGRNGLVGRDGKADDFEHPDRILHEGLSHRAKDPNQLVASVQLTFKHDNDRYILHREISLAQQNVNPKQTRLTLEMMRDGQTLKLERPQQRIEAIIPEGIRWFLFFNGERINYLAMAENSSEVAGAIHQMLGLNLLQTTIKDLRSQNVRGKLRGELRDVATDEKRDLLEQQARSEEAKTEHQERKDNILANLAAIAKELDAVDNKLALNRDARELQARRLRLQQEREDLRNLRDEVTRRLSKLIAVDGYTLFTHDLVKRGQEIVGKLRSEGKIPARVLNTFLQELLECGNCICKRTLEVGTPEREAVESLLTIAGDQDFNNAVGALDHALGLIEGVSAQTEDHLRQHNAERLRLNREIRERDEQIEEIHQDIGGKKDEEVKQLEDKRKALTLQIDEQHAERGRIDGKLEDLNAEIEQLEKQIQQLEDKEEAAALAQRRIDAVEEIIKILEAILESETQDLRPLLNTEIDKHFRQIIDRDYWAELTEDYTLRIRKRIAGENETEEVAEIDAALSTGQRTVTSLVFIASLVALAKKRSEIPTILKGVSGSAFPVAIDSPFGSLSIFRHGVAKYIPELAPQVILFVSPEQYNGQVEQALNESGRVGKRYYLTYHGPTMPERANPDLVVNEHTIQQYFKNDSEEYTEIMEL
jgi:DNA sulfur modification protein DndD